MRLISYDDGAGDHLGVESADGTLWSSGALGGGLPATMAELLAAGEDALSSLRQAAEVAAAHGTGGDVERSSVMAPVPRPGKVIAIGLNYYDHAAEGGVEPPSAPMLFAKFTTAVVGPGATIEWDPTLTEAVDLEAELGVVIGKTARRVSEERALEHVLGYTCINDVSARDLQFADKQFVRSKSLDTFCPMGPALVTADEIADPGQLPIRSILNGTVMQDSNTSQLVFGVASLIAYCSRAFTLEPGDIISTGTPAGVGWYRDPKVLLGDGDVVAIEIDGIGRLENPCRTWRG
jgi:2-keto-4-pentenoate hydratase/2-oxohepta-3-ene-1,7-dioic acid hydratase in catechol pathway